MQFLKKGLQLFLKSLEVQNLEVEKACNQKRESLLVSVGIHANRMGYDKHHQIFKKKSFQEIPLYTEKVRENRKRVKNTSLEKKTGVTKKMTPEITNVNTS